MTYGAHKGIPEIWTGTEKLLVICREPNLNQNDLSMMSLIMPTKTLNPKQIHHFSNNVYVPKIQSVDPVPLTAILRCQLHDLEPLFHFLWFACVSILSLINRQNCERDLKDYIKHLSILTLIDDNCYPVFALI